MTDFEKQMVETAHKIVSDLQRSSADYMVAGPTLAKVLAGGKSTKWDSSLVVHVKSDEELSASDVREYFD